MWAAPGLIFPYKTKKPRLFSRDSLAFFSTFMKRRRWISPQLTQFHAGFVCNFLSSSAGFILCSCFFPAHPCLPLSLQTFSGPSVPHPIGASLPLSDLRCFRSLSVASVLDSDYSASALPFPHLPASASQWLPQCAVSAFASSVFPVLSRLVSRAFFPGSRYSALLFVSFRPSLIRSHSRSSGASLLVRFLSSASFWALSVPPCFLSSASGFPYSATQLSRSSFPLLPSLASRQLVRCPVASFVTPVSSSFHPGFPWLLSDSAYSVLCLVLFRPSRFISRS